MYPVALGEFYFNTPVQEFATHHTLCAFSPSVTEHPTDQISTWPQSQVPSKHTFENCYKAKFQRLLLSDEFGMRFISAARPMFELI